MAYAIILFAITYVLMITLSKYRVYVALTSAIIFVVTGLLPIGEVLGYIDFNVLMMIAGTMGIVALFIESKMPNRLADIIIDRVPNVKWAVIALSLFAGIISAFVDNVATTQDKSRSHDYRDSSFVEFTGSSYSCRRYDLDTAWRRGEHEFHRLFCLSGKAEYLLCS